MIRRREMRRSKRNKPRRRSLCFLALIFFLFPAAGQTADMSTLAAQGTAGAPEEAQQGPPLALDEAVRIAVENHSSVKSAQYQVRAQDAVLHQQMAAYYPTIKFDNNYKIGNTSASSTAAKVSDSLSSTANLSMTLYNFGKREG